MEQTQQTTVETQGVVTTEEIFHKVRMEVIESYPSVYSKDDVILLIDRIQREVGNINGGKMTQDSWGRLRTQIEGKIIEVCNDFDFDGTIDVELNYNRQIEVLFDPRDLRNELVEAVDGVITDFD